MVATDLSFQEFSDYNCLILFVAVFIIEMYLKFRCISENWMNVLVEKLLSAVGFQWIKMGSPGHQSDCQAASS